MKRLIKWVVIGLYWCLSLQGIQFLINYPQDITFYAALVWFILNIYITIKLIKTQKS